MNMDKCTSIRRVNEADLQAMLAWRNSDNVRRFMFTQCEISIEDHRHWFEVATRDEKRHLLIVEDEAEPIGFVQFSHVPQDNTADWGFYARPGAPKGAGTRIGQAALSFAFRELGFHKVCGQAIDTNLPSINLHLKLGFRREGTLRSHKLLNGIYHSLICFGVLDAEWNSLFGKEETENAKD